MAHTWVLLHGTPLNPAAWDDVRMHLPVNAVAPDLNRPVAGPSDSCLPQRELAATVLADDVPDGELTVVGHSLGGQVAMEMALLAPERIRQLILVCTRDIPVSQFVAAAEDLRRGVPLDVDAGIRRWFTPDEIADDGPVVRYARGRLQTVSALAYADALDSLARYDRRHAVTSITAPCVVVCGGLDQGCTPAVMTTLASDLPNSTMRIVDEWAHMSPFVQPETFAALLTSVAAEG